MNTAHIISLVTIAALSILLIAIILLLHLRKKKILKKINAMPLYEKLNLLNMLTTPFGYRYDSVSDLLISRTDAFQKTFGYNTLFDFAAAYFNMVFDYETIYFNYNQRTWLIEFWKGQYGINAGCELGIYYADTIIPKEKLQTTHYTSVSKNDMLYQSLTLKKKPSKKSTNVSDPIVRAQMQHWWLALFRMGRFEKPKNLIMDITLRFPTQAMLYSFISSLTRTLPDISYKTDGLSLSFTYTTSHRRYNLFKRLVRSTALFFCKLYCKWFIFVTRPYKTTLDRLLLIYYYLPFLVRHVIKKYSKRMLK